MSEMSGKSGVLTDSAVHKLELSQEVKRHLMQLNAPQAHTFLHEVRIGKRCAICGWTKKNCKCNVIDV